jgi:hypothetical protein
MLARVRACIYTFIYMYNIYIYIYIYIYVLCVYASIYIYTHTYTYIYTYTCTYTHIHIHIHMHMHMHCMCMHTCIHAEVPRTYNDVFLCAARLKSAGIRGQHHFGAKHLFGAKIKHRGVPSTSQTPHLTHTCGAKHFFAPNPAPRCTSTLATSISHNQPLYLCYHTQSSRTV